MIRSRSYFTRSATFNAVFNYTFGRGKRPHQGPFNETTQNVLGYWSLSRSLNPLYKDGTALIRRSSDNETTIVRVNQETGIADPEQVRAWNGWNLLSRTEELDHANWARIALQGVTANAATTPSGAAAELVIPNNVSTAHYVRQIVTVVSGESYTLSFVAKAGGYNFASVFGAWTGITGQGPVFDLTNGTVANAGGLTCSINSLGDGWYRCTVSGTASSTSLECRLYVSSTSAGSPFAGDTVSGVFFSEAQLERSSSFTTYEPRTTTSAGDSFLVTLYEQAESGKNLLARTEEFDVSPWTNSISGTGVAPTVTANAGTSPLGDSTADRIQFSLGGGTANGDIARRVQFLTPAAGVYTYSIYIKSFDGISSYNMHIIGPTGATTNVVVTGSWQRFTITGTAPGTSVSFGLGLRGAQTPANSNTVDVLVWGAQLEVGTTATTYERRTTHGAGTRLDFTQSTTTLQPIVCEQGVVVTENSRLAAKFVAADARRMSIASSTAMFNALHTTGGSVFCVAKANNTSASKFILATRNGTGDFNSAGFIININDNEQLNVQASTTNTGGNTVAKTETNQNNTSQDILSIFIDPDNVVAESRLSAWRDGGVVDGLTNASSGTPKVENSSSNLTLGSGGTGLFPFDGTISEIALFSSLISTADRIKYEANASRHYGITITESLVSISAHPSSVTTTIDYPYTMTVVVSNATAYQWQYSTDGGTTWLPGNSNTDSITVTTTPAMNGWQWRCVVMNPFGGVISNSATVTVEPLALEGLSIVSSLGGAWSTSRRVLPSYSRTSEVILIRRDSDNATLPIPGDGLLSEIDPNEVRAFNGWNLLINSVFANTAGVAPTSWTNVSTGGTSAAASSTVFTGETAWAFSVTAERNYIRQSVTLAASTTYAITFQVEDITGTIRADQVSWHVVPAGATLTYPVCSANPSGGAAGTVQAGQLTVLVVNSTTAGACEFRIGLGAQSVQTGTLRVSRPQVERAAAFSTYEPRTTTAAGNSFLVTKYDQTGQSRHFTQATTTLQPIVCEQGVPVTEGGRLSAKYVAADARRLSIPSSTAMFNALHTTGGTVLAVSRANDTAATKQLLSNNLANNIAGFRFRRIATEQIAQLVGRLDVAGVATAGNSVSHTTTDAASTAQTVVAWLVDPDNVTATSRSVIYQNGTLASGTNAQTGTPFIENASGDLTLGAAFPGGGEPWDGTISEVVVASDLISTSDRDAWESRTGSFFGVSVS